MGVEHFHAHLDACKRCREQPFNLCVTGEKLLKEAALGRTEKAPRFPEEK
jgi:hypothetical protein